MKKLRQRRIAKAAARIRELVKRKHPHPEAPADLREHAADLARADHPGGLAVQVEAREAGQAEIEVARADIGLVRVPVHGQQQRHRVLRHRVGRVGRDTEDAEPAAACARIHIVEARAPQRDDPDAEPVQLVRDLRVHRVVDEHAHAVKAARELHSVLAQLRLKVPDLQPGPGGVGVKAGAVIGFCIKKSKFHSDPSKPFMAPPAAFYTCRSMQLPPMAGKTQKNPARPGGRPGPAPAAPAAARPAGG